MSFLFTASFSAKPKSKATVIYVNNEHKIFQILEKGLTDKIHLHMSRVSFEAKNGNFLCSIAIITLC